MAVNIHTTDLIHQLIKLIWYIHPTDLSKYNSQTRVWKPLSLTYFINCTKKKKKNYIFCQKKERKYFTLGNSTKSLICSLQPVVLKRQVTQSSAHPVCLWHSLSKHNFLLHSNKEIYSGQLPFCFFFLHNVFSKRGETARAQLLSKVECAAMLRDADPYHTVSLLSLHDVRSTACEPLKLLQYTACSQRAYTRHGTVRTE